MRGRDDQRLGTVGFGARGAGRHRAGRRLDASLAAPTGHGAGSFGGSPGKSGANGASNSVIARHHRARWFPRRLARLGRLSRGGGGCRGAWVHPGGGISREHPAKPKLTSAKTHAGYRVVRTVLPLPRCPPRPRLNGPLGVPPSSMLAQAWRGAGRGCVYSLPSRISATILGGASITSRLVARRVSRVSGGRESTRSICSTAPLSSLAMTPPYAGPIRD